MTNVVAAILGGVVAAVIASAIGLDPEGPGTYRVILVLMAVLVVAALGTVTRLTDDRPHVVHDRGSGSLGEPAAFPADPRRSRTLLGITVRDRRRSRSCSSPGSSSRSGPAR